MASLSNDSMAPDEGPVVVHDLAGLQAQVQDWRNDGARVAFVPTMGALHQGHLSLVTLAGELADRVVVSIFVNPGQFAAHEDLGSYPRTMTSDRAALGGVTCDLIYAPSVKTIYPDSFSTTIEVGGISDTLCGVSRPHFFGGVATVVCKLFHQVQPDLAVFGEKDYQQLLVIRQMVRDLDMKIEIIGGALVREQDGLAMSSRNAYLNPAQRRIAPQLHRELAHAAEAILRQVKSTGSANVSEILATAQTRLLDAGFAKIDYLEVRDQRDLSPLPLQPDAAQCRDGRLFAAAILGETRLIDNWPLNG